MRKLKYLALVKSNDCMKITECYRIGLFPTRKNVVLYIVRVGIYLFIFNWSTSLLSQEQGVLLLEDATAIHGLIYWNEKAPDKVGIRKFKADALTVYTASEVDQFKIGESKLYKSKEVEMSGRFSTLLIETLHEGIINLYSLSTEEQYYFLEESSGQIKTLTRQNFKSVLKEYPRECQRIWNRNIEHSKYNDISLINIIASFNNNCGQLLTFEWGIMGSISRSTAQINAVSFATDEQFSLINNNKQTSAFFNSPYENYSISAMQPGIGIFIEAPLFRPANKVSLLMDLYYSRNQWVNSISAGNHDLDTKIKSEILHLSLGPNYVLSNQNEWMFSLLAGIELYVLLSKEFVTFETVREEVFISNFYNEEMFLSPFLLGGYFGIALKNRWSDTSDISIELRGKIARYPFQDNTVVYNGQSVTLKISI